MGPNGEIPLRRDEDGEVVYMTPEELGSAHKAGTRRSNSLRLLACFTRR